MNILRRLTLQSQTAELLRRHLRGGQWPGPLPGERTLAEQLHVSRVTVRLALAELRREGTIEVVRHRYRRAAVKPGAPHRPRRFAISPIRIGYLCAHPLEDVMIRKLREIYNLQRMLQDASIHLTLIPDSHLGLLKNPAQRLNKLVAENRVNCWVLGVCSAPIQHWFAQQGLPAIISGSAHEGVYLPAFDWNFLAIGRHAAGMLRRHGHRRIVLLTPERLCAGNLEVEKGFFEVFSRPDPVAPHPLVLRYDTPDMIRHLVQKAFSRAPLPTALASLHALDSVTVLTCLQSSGLRVPDDVALICLEGDSTLTHMVPAIAHYEWRTDLLVKRLYRAVIETITGAGKPKSTLIMSRFYPNESLGPAHRRLNTPVHSLPHLPSTTTSM